MGNDSPRADIIDKRVEEICAKVFTGIPPEERQEMRDLIDERIQLMTLPLPYSSKPPA